MKKSFLLIAAAMMVFMVGCHNENKNQNNKVSESDVKKAEQALFNEDQTVNTEAVAEAVSAFSKYAEENPGSADAAEYLFKAVEVSINTRQDAQQSIELVNKLVASYPEYDKNPVALFMMATFVYEEQLGELGKARETYQRIIDNYPDSPFAKDAAIAITQLGMTPDELRKMFEAQSPSEE